MDSKALAKSKRAHSLHHSKKPQKLRVPPPSSTQKPRLPSNWDRYDDGEPPKQQQGGHDDDALLPKSKGADFRHLVEEARSSNQRQVASLDDELLLDDVFPAEFNEGMIRVKGERIASWIEDDNFVVDDGASASNYETSIFSLNLCALSKQLEKVDISERLFIEADLLATDMVTTQEANSGKFGEYEKTEMPSFVEDVNVNHTTDIFLVGSSPGGSEGFKSVDQGFRMTSLVRDDSSSSQRFTSSRSKPSSFDVTTEEGPNMAAIGFSTCDNRSDASNCKSKSSYFEVSASEAELDMLLDTFNVTNVHGSSENNINRTSEVGSAAKGSDVDFQTMADLDSSEDSRAFQSKVMDFHAPVSTGCDILPKKYLSTFETAAAEEELDMLLNSASNSKSQGPRFDSVSNILEELPKPVATFTKEDSDLQIATVAGNLDDVLDDLLLETSKTMNQNSSYRPEKVKSAIGEQPPPSHTLSKSKPLDDFDSWMDTL